MMHMKNVINFAAAVLSFATANVLLGNFRRISDCRKKISAPPRLLKTSARLDGSPIENIGNVAKIVGGTILSSNEYPWYAALYRSGYLYCGGQLISPKFVLTAAHCQPKVGDSVRVGALCPADESNCGQDDNVGKVKRTTQHPSYISSTASITYKVGYDYMLIELDEAVNNIDPVMLDNGSYSPFYMAGKSLWVIGLGLIDVNPHTLPSQLHHVEVEYVPQDTCTEARKPIRLGQATMCAEDSDKMGDACFGDSGGPLYDRENQRLVGLTSYGDSLCVSTKPGVYARISDSFSWIQFNVCLEDPTAELCDDVVAPGSSAPTSKWCRDAEVQVTLNADEYPEETTWYLSELTSFTFVGAGSLKRFEKDMSHKGDFCLPVDENQCYRFDVNDLAGNGIDKDGDDHDYCVTLNGQQIGCNVDFTGNREAVTFPAENCENASFCSIINYELEIATTDSMDYDFTDVLVSIQAVGENSKTFLPYVFGSTDNGSGLLRSTVHTYPIDLCYGDYNLVVVNLGDTKIALNKKGGDVILTQDDLKIILNQDDLTGSSALFANSASHFLNVNAILLTLVGFGVSLVF